MRSSVLAIGEHYARDCEKINVELDKYGVRVWSQVKRKSLKLIPGD